MDPQMTPAKGSTAPSGPDAPARARTRWVVFAAVVLLTALVSFGLGRLPAERESVSDTGPDAGFSRDMQAHHAQAVEMALIIRDKSANAEIRAIAYDIATTQQHQNGQMFAWLRDWGLPQARSQEPMAWMGPGTAGHGTTLSPGGRNKEAARLMEGMATPAQMQGLRASAGAAADRLFTDLMIRHHQGGVAMATAATRLAQTAKVKNLAAGIVKAQTAEINALEELRGRL
ncbi:DUF305 domain-containing protein (plasmid) [Arthrobacter sp. FW305-BF8]|uniref:DUF305 domain-containing protein n=1 Tax=Arthrobacter sp. FW305-BF8 TaxID=2879617 RepID=UPI001F2EB458|nr:DUF305 domain-containing protein [Arthrobacter sp. FW305-BF8]UKA56728.1 DUF305 domain-containing protein [Arthrobacter sp. FW305-BF8]